MGQDGKYKPSLYFPSPFLPQGRREFLPPILRRPGPTPASRKIQSLLEFNDRIFADVNPLVQCGEAQTGHFSEDIPTRPKANITPNFETSPRHNSGVDLRITSPANSRLERPIPV